DAPASSAEHLQRDLAAGPRRAVVARQSNALPQLAQSTTLACLHESLGLHGGCRTNQTACTNLTMAEFADVVRAAQSARAGPSRPKWFTPKPSPCGKPTKSRPRRWFVRQPPPLAGTLAGSVSWSVLVHRGDVVPMHQQQQRDDPPGA